MTLTPQPVLIEEPLAVFTSSDADSGVNGEVHYVVSSVTEEYVVMFDVCNISIDLSAIVL